MSCAFGLMCCLIAPPPAATFSPGGNRLGTHAVHVVPMRTILIPPSGPTNGCMVNSPTQLFFSPDATMSTSGTRYTRTSSASPTPSIQLPAPTMVNMLSLQICYLFGIPGLDLHLSFFWLEFKEKKSQSAIQQ